MKGKYLVYCPQCTDTKAGVSCLVFIDPKNPHTVCRTCGYEFRGFDPRATREQVVESHGQAFADRAFAPKG